MEERPSSGLDPRLRDELRTWFCDALDEVVEHYRGKNVPKREIDRLRKELERRSLECAAAQIALDN
jgi:hypothetical protein